MIDRARVLKQGDTFAIFDPSGDFGSASAPEFGIYHQDTRFLSRLRLRIGNEELLVLSSAVTEANAVLAVDLTNPDLREDGEVEIPRGTILISRSRVLWEAACYDRLRIHNSGREAVEFSLVLEFDADYADLFEVRGIKRARRGRLFPTRVNGNVVQFGYEGLDRQLRRTSIVFDPAPTDLDGSRALYCIRLEGGADATCSFAIRCEPSTESVLDYDGAATRSAAALCSMRAEEPEIITPNEQLNVWLNRSIADLHMMRTETPHGPYPYAGLPWYSTAFGRDGIITALECLWFNPEIAGGVLSYLAATQAVDENPERDAQPGKILHETRHGEMAALGEVPFDRYYGSIDATPLFVILAGAYYEHTGDVDLIRSIWPNIERALNWIDNFGDVDGDGFIEYARLSPRGLLNQGWKDSDNAVFHADGTPAEGPIALCEVQAYVYAAKLAVSNIARILGNEARVEELAQQAKTLRRRFEETFWCEELSTYALALDGKKRLCQVRASNAGHCLFAGIASEDRARRVAATLISEESFSGWGIRTVAASEIRYDPRSYHNGSIWPHDNAIIAAGFARYGLTSEAAKIFAALFEATSFFEAHRLPELFCGFPRRAGEGPTLYPVSCSPQTWASCAVFLLLGACLGLKIDALKRKVVFTNPYLPKFLPELRINRLRVGDASVDLFFVSHETDVEIGIRQNQGRVSVVKQNGSSALRGEARCSS